MAGEANSLPAFEKVRADIRDLWPRLTFYYGISPVELATWPRWLVHLYADRLDRFIAEGQLGAIEATQAVWMEANDQRSVVRYYQKQAKGERESRGSNRMTLRDFIKMGGVGGMGVKQEVA